jgi:hypothetical protein
MADKSLTITVDPESDLGRALDESDATTAVLVKDGARFRVVRDPDDPWATYDPESVLEGLREIAGTLSPEEGARMKEIVYRGREEGTRPITRP